MSSKADDRISRVRLFLSIAHLFGQRSTCPRAQVGAIAVWRGRIIASGYVGAVSGQPHCAESGCDMQDGHCVRTVHAEANVVAWAARAGVSLNGATLYCTHGPCLNCAKLLINAGIVTVVYREKPKPSWGEGLKLLESSLVEVRHEENPR
jgi:dCMP deaminase